MVYYTNAQINRAGTYECLSLEQKEDTSEIIQQMSAGRRFLCYTQPCCDTGPRVLRSHPKNANTYLPSTISKEYWWSILTQIPKGWQFEVSRHKISMDNVELLRLMDLVLWFVIPEYSHRILFLYNIIRALHYYWYI